jgi:deoxyribonuclease V
MPRNPSPLSPLIQQWKLAQQAMREQIIVAPLAIPRFIAGADIAFSNDKSRAIAVALVWDREQNRIVEIASASTPVLAPYIPGFLTFREGPALTEAIGKLKSPFDVLCVDGHGYAHPRRCGLACYMGVTLNIPAIGVAKSRFIRQFAEPAQRAGATSDLIDHDEIIGAVLRTRDKTNPVFISIGHRVDLKSAIAIAMACVTKYRVPEPTRLADIEVARVKRGETR